MTFKQIERYNYIFNGFFYRMYIKILIRVIEIDGEDGNLPL